MANGYGSSSSTTQTTNGQDTQTRVAPPGFHYMPDGTLMSDAEHMALYGEPYNPKIITDFVINTNDIKASGESRTFTVSGTQGAVFSLEIKNGNNYYNFHTNLFQSTESKLSNISIKSGSYTGQVKFPAVSAGAQYDIFLYSETNQNTRHANYTEVRSADGNIDINASKGSISNLVQKVIYQTLDVTVTVTSLNPIATVTGTSGSSTITASRDRSTGKIPFSFNWDVSSTRTLTIKKQPIAGDAFATATVTVGSSPVDIEGENLYPAITETDTVDGDFSESNKIVMDNNVASKMVVGDRVTTPETTDTVDGAVFIRGDGVTTTKIVMDNNVAGKMSVFDAVTGTPELDELKATNNAARVTALNPDSDNPKEFTISATSKTLTIPDGTTLTFTNPINDQIITVAALNPDTDNVKEFSISEALESLTPKAVIRDGITLNFSNQRNHRWPISATSFDVGNIKAGMRTVRGTHFVETSRQVAEYLDQTTVLEGEPGEYKVDNVRIPALDTLNQKPISVRDGTTKVVTTTTGSSTTPVYITFDKQAKLTFGGTSESIYGYGVSNIKSLSGYDIELSDLAVKLTEIKTTTTAAVSNSTSIPISNRDGIMDGISTVSGIGTNTLVKGTDTVDGAVSSGVKVVMDANVANTMSVGDRITGNAALDRATVTVAALNPDGDNAKEFSMSEAIALEDNLPLTFTNKNNLGPKVVSGAGSVTGAGTIVLSAAQTLESGTELTFPGASTTATITGNIKINKVGNANVFIYFDVDKLLTMH